MKRTGKMRRMSKTVISPIERWAGTVTIADPLTLPQAQLIEHAMQPPEVEGEKIWLSTIDANKLPAVQACVEKWELQNFTPDPFPASPRVDSHRLMDWIFAEILTVYMGEAVVPNE